MKIIDSFVSMFLMIYCAAQFLINSDTVKNVNAIEWMILGFVVYITWNVKYARNN